MCRHLIMKEPSTAGPGRTRCGLSIPAERVSIRVYKRTVRLVTCKRCLAWAEKEYGGRHSERNGKFASVINGLRVPHSSLIALREWPPPPSCDGPPPGAPYPWEGA